MKRPHKVIAACWALSAALPPSARPDAIQAIEDLSFFASEANVVTSTLKETRRDLAPSTIYSVSGDDIRRWGIRRLSDLIDRLIPGAFEVSDTDDVIMGFRGIGSDSNKKVLLLINGHYAQMQWNNGPSTEVVLSMMEDIETVEVISGPGSALYGSDPTIGIINIITESARTESGQGARVAGSYGSGDYKQWHMVSGAKPSDDLDYYFSMGGMQSHGINVNDNAPLNVDRFPASFRFYGNINRKKTRLMTRYTSSSMTFYTNPVSKTKPNIWTNFDTLFVDAQRDFEPSDHLKWTLNLAFDQGQVARHDFTTGVKIRGVGEARYGVKATGFYTRFERHDLAGGMEYRLDDFGGDLGDANFNLTVNVGTSTVTGIPADPFTKRVLTPYQRNVFGTFAQDMISLADSVNLLLGLRYDYVQNKRPGTRQEAVTPRGALVVNPGDRWVFKLMYTTGFRQAQGAFASPDGFAQGGIYVGGITQPETVRSYEASASYKLNRGTNFELNTYYNTLNHIHGNNILTGVLDSSGKIDFLGGEAIATVSPADRWWGRVIHQTVRLGHNKFDPVGLHTTPDKAHLASYPEDVTKLLLEYRPASRLSLNANSNLVWRTFARTGPIGKIGYYATLNANISYTLENGTQFVLSGYNLTDNDSPMPSAAFGITSAIAPTTFTAYVRMKM